MNFENGIKQSEVESLHSLPINAAKRWRDKNLSRGPDWDKDGKVIYWSQPAYALFKASLNPESITKDSPEQAEEAAADPTVIQLRIYKKAANPTFAYGDLNGQSVAVRCHRNVRDRLIGKPANVRVSIENGETIYTHQP